MLLLTMTACDGGSGGWGAGSSYSVQGSLEQLPAAESGSGQVMIQTADLDAASELSGLERPTDVDGDALVAWLMPLTGGPSDDGPAPVFVPLAQVFNPQSIRMHDEFADELGWSLVDAQAFVERLSPPQSLAVIAGDFDDSTLSEDLPEVADGVVTAGEGEDLESNLTELTNARPLGIPLRLAQNDHLIAAGPSTAEISSWLAGPDETLGDDPHLAGVAAALDDADSVSAVLVTGASMALTDALGAMSAEQVAALEDRLAPMLPEAFQAVGVGWGADDGASIITLAYSFDSEDAAEKSVPLFEELFANGTSLQAAQPLSDLLTLDDAGRNGEVVVLTVSVPEGRSPGDVFQMLQRADVPFLHR